MFKHIYRFILLSCVLISSSYGDTLDEILAKEIHKNTNISEKLQAFKVLELKYAHDKNISSSFDSEYKDDYTSVMKVIQGIFESLKMTTKTSLDEAKVLVGARNYLQSVHNVVFEVSKNYLKVLHAQERLHIAREIQESYKKIYAEIDSAYNLGLRTDAERVSFQSLLTLAKAEVERGKTNESKTQEAYKNLLGAFLSSAQKDIPDFESKLPIDKEQIIIDTIEYNPSLFQYRYNIHELALIENEFLHTQATSKERIVFQNIKIKELKKQITDEIEPFWSINKRLKEKQLNLKWYSYYYAATLAHLEQEYSAGKKISLDVLLAKNDILKSRKDISETKYKILYTQLRLLDVMGSLVPQITKNEKLSKVEKVSQEIITLHINFKRATAILPDNIAEVLVKLSSYLHSNSHKKVKITGHTSRTKHSKELSNIRLSLQRANSLKDELINEYGIDAKRFTTYGKGHSEPIADNDTAEGRVKNRRIEIELVE